MTDNELYQQILGLAAPWAVRSVKLNVREERIDVRVEHPRGTLFECPECGRQLSCHDHVAERQWRHLDSCQFKTFLCASVPRVKCPEHGVLQVKVPWAEKSSRFTVMFERFAIDVLLACQTVKGAKSLLRISWDQTWKILTRAVKRGQARKVQQLMPRIGIDEKAFRKGHSYMTLLYNLDTSTVEAIAEGKDTDAANACFSQLSEAQLAGVEAIAMDMSPAFERAANETFALAEEKIVHDRFHVMKLANEAVDKVRREEHKRLARRGDKRLSRTKYIWLKGQERLTEKQQARMNQAFSLQLKTGKAWAYKEMLRDLWAHETPEKAREFFNDWYQRVIRTKLAPLKKVATTIKGRLANVVNYCRHRITNGVAEGMNSKIMSIKRRAGGYRNSENFKIAIYFYCGGLELYPQ